MNDFEFCEWCERLKLHGFAIELLTRIRSECPYRKVQNWFGNVIGRYPSMKVGKTMQTESHGEFALAITLEHDPKVFEYYDQPGPISIRYRNREGRSIGFEHVPDFLVLRELSVGYEEFKPESSLIELAKKAPERYQKNADGSWSSPPGERAAAKFGFGYRVWSSSDLNSILVRNSIFLQDYLRNSTGESEDASQAPIIEFIISHPGASLAELIDQGFEPDPIFRLLVAKRIYADIEKQRLCNAKSVNFFCDATTARAFHLQISSIADNEAMASVRKVSIREGLKISLSNKSVGIVHVHDRRIYLKADDGEALELGIDEWERLITVGGIRPIPASDPTSPESEHALQILSTTSRFELAKANERESHLRRLVDEDGQVRSDLARPLTRTERRWISDRRRALRTLGRGYFGLISRTSKRGNRRPKIGEQTRTLMSKFIEERYDVSKAAKLWFNFHLRLCGGVF